MQIIPVLDLKRGQVVRAEKGRRDDYRPIVTPLSESSDPVAVAQGLRRLYPFPTFYIADIDAIEGRAPNDSAIERLAAMPRAPDLWVDAGFCDESSLAPTLAMAKFHAVLGSESQRDTALLHRFKGHPRLILSLDFSDDGFRGPTSLLDAPELWPERVIVMTLAKVGAAAGPDLSRLAEIKAKAGRRMLIAAGGVRNTADLRQLSGLDIAAALVATSLHNGTLAARDIEAFA